MPLGDATACKGQCRPYKAPHIGVIEGPTWTGKEGRDARCRREKYGSPHCRDMLRSYNRGTCRRADNLQTTCCSIPAPYDLPRILRYSGYNEGHEARASKHNYLCACLCMLTPDGCSRYRAAHGEDICGRACCSFFPNADGQHTTSESINIPAGCTQCFER